VAQQPVAGVDYPRTEKEFHDWFRTERDCVLFVARLRWPEGFMCPSCGAKAKPYRRSRNRLTCRVCHRDTSVTAGTIFDGTRIGLDTWFHLCWDVTADKRGASAVNQLQQMGIRSYETAWSVLHKLRRAMVRPGRDYLGVEPRPLSPAGVAAGREPEERFEVEMDECFVGGVEKGVVWQTDEDQVDRGSGGRGER
jgi:transposase-like protein